MSTAVLELNDQALLIKASSGEVYSEPGFALHTEQGIVSGIEARNQAWLQPQNVYRQYWHHLSQNPLRGNLRWARHHADIAFAQLKSLLGHAGQPEKLIISVGANFDDQQLSLLLGLLSAIPTEVIAVVDSSLADCLNLSADKQKILHIDLHLHQTVVSQINCSGNSIEVAEQRLLGELGALSTYALLANHIRDRLVATFRYDPMHSPQEEQAIYNLLPEWILRVGQQSECPISIPSANGDLALTLHRQELLDLMAPRLTELSALLREMSDHAIHFSQQSRILSVLTDKPDASHHLQNTQGVDNCLHFISSLVDDSQGLQRITSLQQIDGNRPRPAIQTNGPSTATHLLYKGQAWPLNQPLGIQIDNSRIAISSADTNRASLVLIVENQQLKVLQQTVDAVIELPPQARCGENIIINAQRLALIEVRNG